MIGLTLWAVTVLMLHLLAYRLSPQLLWGATPYTVLPLWTGMLLALAAVIPLHPGANAYLRRQLSAVWQMIPGKAYPQRWFFALAIVSLPIFWLGRIRHLRWGDAAILVAGLSVRDAPVLYNWQAPFTVFLHQRLWALVIDPLFGWGVEITYALISVVCGTVFVWVTLNLVFTITDSSVERWAIAGLVLTTGTMELFFGYVENYTIITLGVMVFLWLGVRAVQGKSPLWAAILALSLTNAFHPSTVILWPAALYLGWQCQRRGLAWVSLVQAMIVPALLVAGTVLTLMELGDHGLAALLGDDRPGGGDHIWLVPLVLATPTQWQQYAMFSAAHLLDWANLLLLTCPFGVPILAAAGWQSLRGRLVPAIDPANRVIGQFLAIAAVGYLLLTWVWNADYGIRKDWDLFSPSAIACSVLAGLLLPRLLCNRKNISRASLIIGLIGGLHTVVWVISNAWQSPVF